MPDRICPTCKKPIDFTKLHGPSVVDLPDGCVRLRCPACAAGVVLDPTRQKVTHSMSRAQLDELEQGETVARAQSVQQQRLLAVLQTEHATLLAEHTQLQGAYSAVCAELEKTRQAAQQLLAQNTYLQQRVETMEGHPDVIAAAHARAQEQHAAAMKALETSAARLAQFEKRHADDVRPQDGPRDDTPAALADSPGADRPA